MTGGYRGGMMGGYGPGMMMGGYGGPMAALKLTDEQQDKLFAIQEANRKKNWDTMSSMRSDSRLDMRKQMESVLTPSRRSSCASSAMVDERGCGIEWW